VALLGFSFYIIIMEYYKNLDLKDLFYINYDGLVCCEEWRDVYGYEGYYQASVLGRVKCLSRIILKKGKYPFQSKEKISKQSINSRGYLNVSLSKDGIKEKISTHAVIAMAFLNHTRDGGITQVDHIKEGNKLDNMVVNLQLLTPRDNVIKHKKTLKSTSEFTGVSWYKKYEKWRATIQINRKIKHLGYFINEIDAYNAYQKAIKNPLIQGV